MIKLTQANTLPIDYKIFIKSNIMIHIIKL